MFRQVFDPENLFWRLISRGVDFAGLSLFWAALCLPIVTIGPATAALYYTAVRIFRHKGDGAFGMYWRSFVQNLRQGIPATLIFLPVMALLIYGYLIMYANAGAGMGTVMYMAYYVVLLVPVGMFCYLFPLMGRFEMGLGGLFRNALVLSLRHLPSTVVIVLLTVQMVSFGVQLWWPVFFAPVLCALLSSLFLERIFAKYLSAEDRSALDERPPTEDEPKDGSPEA